MAKKAGSNPKYDWKQIEADYRAGLSRKEIMRRHGCSEARLSEKIKMGGWEISEAKITTVRDFVKTTEDLSKFSSESPEDALALNRAIKIEQNRQRAEGTNISLISGLQSLVARWIKEDEIDVGVFKQITGGLKDIQDIIMPKPTVAIQNNFQNEKPQKVEIIRRAD